MNCPLALYHSLNIFLIIAHDSPIDIHLTFIKFCRFLSHKNGSDLCVILQLIQGLHIRPAIEQNVVPMAFSGSCPCIGIGILVILSVLHLLIILTSSTTSSHHPYVILFFCCHPPTTFQHCHLSSRALQDAWSLLR